MLEYYIAGRFLKAPKNQRFISFTTLMAVTGISIAEMVLVIVMAVMTGAEYHIQDRILGIQPHVTIMRQGGEVFPEYRAVIKQVKSIKGVQRAEPFIYNQIMLRSAAGMRGGILKGMQEHPKQDVFTNLIFKKYITDDSRSAVIGKILAEELKVKTGDTILVMLNRSGTALGQVPGMHRLLVAGVVETGLYEYDKVFVGMRLAAAQKLLKIEDRVSGIGVHVKHIFKAGEISTTIRTLLGFPYFSRDWFQHNRNIFSALKLQKTIMFILLILIMLVAGFAITSTLIMMIMEKTKDIGILKAMGLTGSGIRNIFMLKGLIIGGIGTLIGVGSGIILCCLIEKFGPDILQLPPDIYYFKTLPVKIVLTDILMVAGTSILICLASAIHPAIQAARLSPVDAIRSGTK